MAEKTYTHPHREQERPHAELHNHELEKLDQLVERGHHPRHEQAGHEQAPDEQAEKLNELRQETQAEALPAANLQEQQQRQEVRAEATSLVNHDLKDIKYKRTLQSVRKDLSVPERALSKVIHNPAVDAISAAAENTVARPSGFLAGSIFACLGSSAFLYFAKHYGYEYNFLIFALFFAAGFVLGLLIELLYRIFKKVPKS